MERARLLGCVDDRLGQSDRPLATVLERRVDLRRVCASLDRERARELELLGRVGRELVHPDDRLQAEAVDDPDVARHVRGACLDLGEAAVDVAAVVLERLDAGDEHDGVRPQIAEPAGDVEELLHSHVRGEPALRDHVVAELEGDAVGDERVVAVGDVRERAAVDERRLALEGLDEVGLDRLLEQHRHRAGGLDLLGGDGLAFVRLADRDRTETLPKVGEIAGDRDERHHLAARRDVESGLARVAVDAAAEAGDDVAQRTVVHVHAPPPRDRDRVDPELVAVQQVRVDHRAEEIVRGGDRVQVAGEMEVEVLHRNDLRESASGRSALDAEDGPERRLAQRQHRLVAERAEALRQRDRRRRLPLARGRRRDRGDVDQLRVRPVGEAVDDGEVDLALVAAELLELVGLDARIGGDVGDRTQLRGLGDLEAREHFGQFLSSVVRSMTRRYGV